MHTFIKYEGTNFEKEQKALKDIEEWFGDRWETVVPVMVHEVARGVTPKQFELLCSFAGIEGYPVQVLYKYITASLVEE